MNLLESFKTFLFSQESKPSAITVKNYVSDVNHFIRWYEQKFQKLFVPLDLSAQTLDQYRENIGSVFSPSSAERHLSSLRKFFYFLRIDNKISFDPFKSIEKTNSESNDIFGIKDFKNFLYTSNSSHLTIKNYIIDIKQFLKWAEEISKGGVNSNNHYDSLLGILSSDLIEEYKKRLIEEANFSPATVNRKLSSLRKYLNWAQSKNLIAGLDCQINNIEEKISTGTVNIPLPIEALAQPISQPKLRPYSSFPPLRIIQKVSNAFIIGLDSLIIFRLVDLTEKISFLLWKNKGKPVFQVDKSEIRKNKFSYKDILGIKNLPKEVYAPLEISTKYFPLYKKIWFKLRYYRPNWYKRYHSYSIVHYFHFAVLIIFMAALGYGFYNSFIQKTPNNPTLAVGPVAPPRILSFQGRLTDNNDNPITSTSLLRFAIYNSPTASGGALLWEEQDGVSPDTDGIFNQILGNVSVIPQSLFAQNAALYLGVTVGVTPELTPRQQLATVAYATNAELLQGMPPITDTSGGTLTTNTVLALNSSGNLSIGGSATPIFEATGGSFTVRGSGLVLSTTSGSNGNISLTPDGSGKVGINTTTPLASFDVRPNNSDGGTIAVASVSGKSSFANLVVDQTGNGDLFTASASGNPLFTITKQGRVGIGTTLPTQKLDINGNINLSNSTSNTIFYGGNGLAVPGNGSAGEKIQLFGTAGTVNSTDYAIGVANSTFWFNSAANYYWYVNSVEKARLDNSGSFGLNLASGSMLSTLDVRPNIVNGGTIAVASVSGKTSFAGLVVDNSGVGDLFAASASGLTLFTITKAGNLIPGTNAGQDLGSTTRAWRNVYGTTYYSGATIGVTASLGCVSSTLGIVTGSGACPGASGSSPFNDTVTAGTITENNTTEDLLIGGTSTTSAKFAITNVNGARGTQTASLSGSLTLDSSTASIQTTNNQLITIGGNTTGDIQFKPGNSSSSLYLSSTGNVGIGTTVPSENLTIANVANYNTGLKLTGSSTNGVGLAIENTSSNGHKYDLLSSGSSNSTGVGYFGLFDETALEYRITISPTGTFGINTFTPLATFDIRGKSGTLPIASVSGSTSFASLVVDQTGVGDLFTASASGLPLFTITKLGNVVPGTNNGQDLGSSTRGFRTVYGNQYYSGATIGVTASLGCVSSTLGIVTGSGACPGGTTTSPFNDTVTAGTITQNNTTEDLLIGGISSSSALFRVTGSAAFAGTTSVASIAAHTSFAAMVIDQAGVGDLFTASAAGNPLFVIKKNGNVGIGVSNPTVPLDIQGNLRVNSGDIVQTGFFVIKNTSSSVILQTDTANIISFRPNGVESVIVGTTGRLGVGTATPLATLDVRPTITKAGTLAVASISGATSFASLVVDQTGVGDLFSASASGLPIFTITQAGNLIPGINAGQDLGSSTKAWRNVYGTTYFSGASTGVTTTGCVSSTLGIVTGSSTCPNGNSPFAELSGAIIQNNITEDLLLGATASTSAKFRVTGSSNLAGTDSVASIAANTSFAAMVIDQTGVGDLFTASKSGNPIFTISKNASVNIGSGGNGSLAIGTNAVPGAMLEISKTAASNIGPTILLANNGGGGSERADINFGRTSSDLRAKIEFNIRGGGAGEIFFFTGANAGTESMRINGDRYLGLGTSSPIAELHVSRPLTFTPTGKSLVIFDQLENQNIFTASFGGVTKFVIANDGSVGINAGNKNVSPLGALDVRVTSATLPVASLSGSTNFASLVVDQTGNGDIFTASASGSTRFVIGVNGNLQLVGGQTSDIDTLTNTTLKIGNVSATTITLGRSGQGITLPGFTAQNGVLYGTQTTGVLAQATTASSGQCLLSGASNPTWGSCSGSASTGPFTEITSNGTIIQNNQTEDLLLGGTATTSARFHVYGLANLAGTQPVASIGAKTSFATLVVDNSGVGDIFTASASGLPIFTITQAGNLIPGTNAGQDLGSTTRGFRNVYGTTYFSGATTGVTTTGCVSSTLGIVTGSSTCPNGNSPFSQITGGLIVPNNSTDDFVFGSSAQASTSATFHLYGTNALAGTQAVASIGANTSFAAMVIDQIGKGDLFTASAAGLPLFTITKAGNINLNGFTPSISAAGTSTLTLNNGSTGNIQFFSSSNTLDQNGNLIIAGNIRINGNGILDSAGTTRISLGATTTLTNTTTTLSGTTTITASSLATLTSSTALNINPNTGTALTLDTSATTLTAFGTPTSFTLGGAASTFNIGPSGSTATSINLAGGSGSTGCTVDGATGNLTCSGDNLTTATTGVQGWWSVSSGSISPTNSTLDLLIGGQASTSALFRVTGKAAFAGTTSVASIAANTSFAAMVIDQTGLGDLFTGSAAGSTRFVIGRGGNLQLVGGQTSDIDTLTATTLKIGATNATTLTLGRSGQGITLPGFNQAGGLFYSNSGALTLTAIGTSTQCLLGGATPSFGACSTGTTTSPFNDTVTAGTITQNNTTEDLLIGGISSSSALFRVTGSAAFAGTTSVASIAAHTSFAGLVVDQTGVGDLFTASASGNPLFTISKSGNVQIGTYASQPAQQSNGLVVSGNVGIGTSNPVEKLQVTGGNVLIDSQTNTTAANMQAWSKITGTAGTIGGNNTSIASISASVVYNGSLYVGTNKADGAEVYRYSGTSGTWTAVSQAAGTISSAGGATTAIDRISSMIVYNGYLYIGTTEPAKAEVYRYDGGAGNWTQLNITGTPGKFNTQVGTDGVSSMAVYGGKLFIGTAIPTKAQLYRYEGGTTWTIINTTAGTFVTTDSASVNAVTSMVVFQGSLYLGLRKGGDADVIRYSGTDPGASVFVTLGLTGTTGSFDINAGAITAFNDATLAVWDNRLIVGLSKANAAEVVYWNANSAFTTTNVWTRMGNAAGTISSAASATANIDGISALTTYNGRLYVGTFEPSAGEIYRYDANPGAWTEVSQNTAGSIAAGGTGTIDAVSTLTSVQNNFLFAGTQKATSAEGYSYTGVIDQSFALKFHAATAQGGGEQNSQLNTGSIAFVASSSANANSTSNGTGNFVFSAGILSDSGSYDVAEDYPTRDDTLEPGDIITIEQNETGFVKKSSASYDTQLLGVYSASPGLRLSQQGDLNGGTAIPVALVGRVPVKVSNQNGVIKSGDYITSSTIPGVGMKATRAGPVVGKALQNFDSSLCNDPEKPCTQTLIIFVSAGYYDPTPPIITAVENLGNFAINISTESGALVTDAFGNTISQAQVLGNSLIGTLKAGFINAQNISTSSLSIATENVTIGGQNIRSYIASVVTDILNNDIVSPISSSDVIHTNIISPMTDGKIAIKVDSDKISILSGNLASSSAVASFDNKGNATFSGTLAAKNINSDDASIAGTLRARRIIADQIEGLNATGSSTYINNVTNVYNSTPSSSDNFGLISQGTDSNISSRNVFANMASYSGQLAYVDNLEAANASFSQGLMVFGPTALSDTSIVGQLSINGSMILSNNSINTLGNDLNLQPLKQGGLSIMAGLIYIDTNGNAKFQKDATVEGTLYANIISPIPGKDLTVNLGNTQTKSKFTINSASSSAVLTINSLGDLVASGEATFSKLNLSLTQPAFALSEKEVSATGSAGAASIQTHNTELTIDNKSVTEKSLIYITPTSSTGNQVLFLLRQVPGVSFTVGVENPADKNIPFNWIIVN